MYSFARLLCFTSYYTTLYISGVIMTQLTRSTKVALMVGAVLILVIPLVIAALRYPPISRYFFPMFDTSPSVESVRYRAESSVSGRELTLSDTAYLDWLTTKLKLFDEKGVIDPGYYYSSNKDNIARHTVTSIAFRLVDRVDFPLSSLFVNSKPFEPVERLAGADYMVEGKTLLVSVYMDIPKMERDAIHNDIEKKFIQLITQVLYSASDLTFAQTGFIQNTEILAGIRDNLESGIFRWPFLIRGVK